MTDVDRPGGVAASVLAVALGVASLVVTVAVLAAFSPLLAVDIAVAGGLHGYALDNPAFVVGLQTWTDLFGPWTFRVLLAIVGAWLLWRRQLLMAAWTFGAVVLAAAVEGGLKMVVGRSRPQWTHPVSEAVGPSFPSGHALTAAMGCAVLLVLAWPRLGRPARLICSFLAVVVVAVTGFTRLGLGVHFVSDVVGGWLVAATLVVAMFWALGRIRGSTGGK